MFGYSLSNSCVTLTWKNLFLFQEEEERKRKEEQERKEHEEYLLLKEQFTVEEEGVGETAEEVSDYHANCHRSMYTRQSYEYLLSDDKLFVLVVSNEII